MSTYTEAFDSLCGNCAGVDIMDLDEDDVRAQALVTEPVPSEITIVEAIRGLREYQDGASLTPAGSRQPAPRGIRGRRIEMTKYAIRPTADGYVPQANPSASVVVVYDSLESARAECDRVNAINARPMSERSRQEMVDYADNEESAQR